MASIEERVSKIVSDHLGVKPDQVTPTADLFEDLGADSLDAVELVMGVEEEFELEVPDEDGEKFRRVEDISKYVRQHMSGADDT